MRGFIMSLILLFCFFSDIRESHLIPTITRKSSKSIFADMLKFNKHQADTKTDNNFYEICEQNETSNSDFMKVNTVKKVFVPKLNINKEWFSTSSSFDTINTNENGQQTFESTTLLNIIEKTNNLLKYTKPNKYDVENAFELDFFSENSNKDKNNSNFSKTGNKKNKILYNGDKKNIHTIELKPQNRFLRYNQHESQRKRNHEFFHSKNTPYDQQNNPFFNFETSRKNYIFRTTCTFTQSHCDSATEPCIKSKETKCSRSDINCDATTSCENIQCQNQCKNEIYETQEENYPTESYYYAIPPIIQIFPGATTEYVTGDVHIPDFTITEPSNSETPDYEGCDQRHNSTPPICDSIKSAKPIICKYNSEIDRLKKITCFYIGDLDTVVSHLAEKMIKKCKLDKVKQHLSAHEILNNYFTSGVSSRGVNLASIVFLSFILEIVMS